MNDSYDWIQHLRDVLIVGPVFMEEVRIPDSPMGLIARELHDGYTQIEQAQVVDALRQAGHALTLDEIGLALGWIIDGRTDVQRVVTYLRAALMENRLYLHADDTISLRW